MTNKSAMVSVPRELLERVTRDPMGISARKGHWGSVRELAELLAAPAEDVRAVVDEPVAWIKADVAATLTDDECCYAFGKQSPKGNLVPLYLRPQRPVVSQCSEVSPQCSEHLRTQGKLFACHTLLPHPPRHWGFLQPEREVPGYTIEQMKEYGALCAAEALRQNK